MLQSMHSLLHSLTPPPPTPPHQAESAHLDVGSIQRRLEADAALARKEAAQMESRYKAERAHWLAEVDMQKIEVARLSRELEGLEEQRARAREEAQRAEQARIQLEAEIKVGRGRRRGVGGWGDALCWWRRVHTAKLLLMKTKYSTHPKLTHSKPTTPNSCHARDHPPQELRKSADQRMREAQMTQGEVSKALRDERAAFEKKEAQMTVGCAASCFVGGVLICCRGFAGLP